MSGAEAELLCNLSGLLSYSRLEASILHLLPRGIKGKADGIQQTWMAPRCLKITEKISFNIASEASYVYILGGQKFIENAINGVFWSISNPEACGKTVLPDRSTLIGQKLVEMPKLKN